MRHFAYPTLFVLLLALGGCRENREVQPDLPDLSVQGQLKKKLYVATDDPSRVLYATEYEYGPDQKLLKTATYSFRDDQPVLQEYTEYAYDDLGLPDSSIQYTLTASGTFLPFLQSDFEYRQGVLVRETVASAAHTSYYTYEYAADRLVRKSYFEGSNTLLRHTDFQYDDLGKLIRETTVDAAGKPYAYAQLTYRNGLLFQREEFSGDPESGKADLWRRIRFSHNSQKRLAFEKTDYVSPLSSAIHPSVRYEYY